MKNLKPLSLGVLMIGLATIGCGKSTESTPKAEEKKTEKITQKEDDHDHGEGPHGGIILEFKKYHGEFVVDHAKKTATVYILDGRVKYPAPIAVTKLTLSVKAPAYQVEMAATPLENDPKGKASRFVATHDILAKEQEFEGTVSFEMDGKPYSDDFKYKPETDHKHGK